MRREISLDGGELTVLKAIGMSGSQMPGKMLLEHMGNMAGPEFIETLMGLMDRGYVLSSKVNVRNVDDVERSLFRVNPSYTRDLRDAMRHDFGREKEQRRRRRS